MEGGGGIDPSGGEGGARRAPKLTHAPSTRGAPLIIFEVPPPLPSSFSSSKVTFSFLVSIIAEPLNPANGTPLN
jgi:hypothetical protein